MDIFTQEKSARFTEPAALYGGDADFASRNNNICFNL